MKFMSLVLSAALLLGSFSLAVAACSPEEAQSKANCELSRYLRISVTQVENENPLKFGFGTALAMGFFLRDFFVAKIKALRRQFEVA